MSTAATASQFIGTLSGNPALVENRAGGGANLDLVAPLAAGGMVHLVRIESGMWLGPFRFGKDLRETVEACSMIQSNFGGNLEVLVRTRYSLKLLWLSSGRWFGPIHVPSPLTAGVPSLIQSTRGVRGNFEIVTPLCGGRIAYISRDNDDPRRPWRSSVFGREPSQQATENRIAAVSLIQSNAGLEVVARYGNDLDIYWSTDPMSNWKTIDGPFHTGETDAPGPAGNPVLVKSRIGALPASEVLVPWSSGGIAHFYRETGGPYGAWIGPTMLLTELGFIDDIAVSDTQEGGLLLMGRSGNEIWFARRGADLRWQTPVPLLSQGPAHAR